MQETITSVCEIRVATMVCPRNTLSKFKQHLVVSGTSRWSDPICVNSEVGKGRTWPTTSALIEELPWLKETDHAHLSSMWERSSLSGKD